MSDKLQELTEEYKAYAEKNGVIELPLDYEWAAEMTINTFKRNYLPLIWKAAFFIMLAIFLVIIFRRRRRTV